MGSTERAIYYPAVETVLDAYGPPFLLGLTSFGSINSGTSIPIDKSTSASIDWIVTSLRCGHQSKSSCFATVSTDTGNFGLVNTTGSSTIFSSCRSRTSRLTTRLLALLFSYSIVVSRWAQLHSKFLRTKRRVRAII